MRLFGIKTDGSFVQYVEQDFAVEHRERILEDWLEANPSSIVDGSKLLVIGRQAHTNLGSTIDILAVDSTGAVVVVELKRDRTPRDTLAQALEYASFVEQLSYDQLDQVFREYSGGDVDSLAEHHAEYFNLDGQSAVSFNKEQTIVIVGAAISPQIRQTAAFLGKKGLRVTCVEFGFFQTASGEQLLSVETVVQPSAVETSLVVAPRPTTSEQKFLSEADGAGRPVFETLLALARQEGLPVHWGSRGFSLNVDLDGKHVAICFGYPPSSVYKQSIYTGFADIRRRLPDAEAAVASARLAVEKTGLFIVAKGEMKCVLINPLTSEQLDSIREAVLSVVEEVRRQPDLV